MASAQNNATKNWSLDVREEVVASSGGDWNPEVVAFSDTSIEEDRMSIAYQIIDADGTVIWEEREVVEIEPEHRANFVGELVGAIKAAEAAIAMGYEKMYIFTDLQFIPQNLGPQSYNKRPELITLIEYLSLLVENELGEYKVQWLPREMNERADQLAKGNEKPESPLHNADTIIEEQYIF